MQVTSSGTSGKFSQVGFDWGAMFAEVPMVLKLGWRHGLVSLRPANYVVLGYKPHRENHTGVTRTMFGLTFFAPPLRRFYALRMEQGRYVPDLDGAARALAQFARSPFPTRIVGFPSYLWFGLKRMEELGLSLQLRPGSKILLAGGWKQHAASRWKNPSSTIWPDGCWALRRTHPRAVRGGGAPHFLQHLPESPLPCAHLR